MFNPSDIVLEAKHVVKQFPASDGRLLTACNDVTLNVYRGKTLGIVGESGCGKSTFVRMLTQMDTPTSGEILLHGKDILHLKGEERRLNRQNLQMVFQDPLASFNPKMKVMDILTEPLRNFGRLKRADREAKARELLRMVELPEDFVYRYPHSMSGGQRQRIGIARALAPNPRLIVCDEPVSALDVSIQAQILNLLKKLQKQSNLTYLFISHDLAVVRYISDRVCVMFLGQICELCSTVEAYEKPLHPYTRMLIDSAPEPDPDFHREDRMLLQGELPSPVNPPAGCRFCTRCPFATDVCRTVHPELKEYTPGHFCACHHPLAE